MTERLLEVKDLHTSFFTPSGEVKAVNGVSFSLDRHKVLGIVGESGSGKSVFTELFVGMLDKNGKIKGANLKRGAKLFYQNCRPCHGEDGRRVNVNPSGKPTYIGERAREDMPTFWYQMNFGDEERNMEAYYDEISLDEMKDIAGYAQTLP